MKLRFKPRSFDQQMLMLSPVRLWPVSGSPLEGRGPDPNATQNPATGGTITRQKKLKKVTPGFLNKGKKNTETGQCIPKLRKMRNFHNERWDAAALNRMVSVSHTLGHGKIIILYKQGSSEGKDLEDTFLARSFQ